MPYYDFFKDVQKNLRAQGDAQGLWPRVPADHQRQRSATPLFNYFLIAYGGQDIVTKDGKLHLDDPKVREAAIKALTYPTTAYKEGFVPPGAINWNDADDNNAFHAKQIVMDLDGTLSTEVAVLSQERRRITTTSSRWACALSNDGKPVPSRASSLCGLIPKGAKNVAVAKDFLKYLIQPKVCNEYAEDRARPQTCRRCRSIVKDDPWWLDQDPHRAAYVHAGPARPDPAAILGLQPGLCPGPERACLARPPGRTSSPAG